MPEEFYDAALTNAERAEVLCQALPYIKRYVGKVVAVKYGGNAMVDETLKRQVMQDIALLWLVGVRVVLIHGGGPEINRMMERVGKEPEFIGGLRVTDADTVGLVQMVLAGKVNKDLVGLLESMGASAVGLCGMDGRLIEARCKDERLGYVGEVARVNPGVVEDLLDLGYVPVVSTLGCDEAGRAYNINGDTAAAALAGALGAERLLMLTDIAGVLRDRDDPASLIGRMTVDEARALETEGVVAGGMIPKVECCVHAIEDGVGNVVIMDGRVPHSILMELLTDEGAGTMVTRGAAAQTGTEGTHGV